MNGMPLFELRGVTRTFPGAKGESPVQALRDVSLCVNRGEFVCLLGRSGCGKSTLLSLLAGLDMPTTGSVFCDGKNITGPAPDRMLMFQEAALFPWLNVMENVLFGMEARRNWPREEKRKHAVKWLGAMGLASFAAFRVHELSGGMRQRTALARALAAKPEALLMDEPFSALDAMTRERLYSDVQRVWQDNGTTVVMVTHNVREAVCLGTRVLLMDADPGEIVDDMPVTLPRPRRMNDVALIRVAAKVSAGLRATRSGRDGSDKEAL